MSIVSAAHISRLDGSIQKYPFSESTPDKTQYVDEPSFREVGDPSSTIGHFKLIREQRLSALLLAS